MMNQAQALVYGKKTGCRYYVRNSVGGLFGGFVRRADAEACLKKAEADWYSSPWENEKVDFFIVEE